MWQFWYPTRMLHLFCPVSSPFVKSYFGREFSWFLQQSFKLEMKNLFFGNLSGKNHPDWSLIKTLIYCFCWVFKHFSVQIFFTSYFEKHPSSTITAVHHLYHNNAPKVRDALYMASAKFFKGSPLSHTGIFDSDEVQSTDSPFSLPVLRLNHGNCKVFSAAASQPTPTGISARSTSELQSQLFGHEKSSSPILSMANHSATRWGPRSVLASPWLGTNL